MAGQHATSAPAPLGSGPNHKPSRPNLTARAVRAMFGLLWSNASVLLLMIPALLYLPAVSLWAVPSRVSVVMSDSMNPVFFAGDLVFLRPPKDIEVGDVVAFETPRGTPGFPPRILHRVVEYDREGARLTTKGDANPDSDPFKVGIESLLGEATGIRVPYAGFVSLFLQSRYGKTWIAILAPLFAVPTLTRMGRQLGSTAQRVVTETVGVDAERLLRIESGLDQNRQVLSQFSSAISEYATHLRSHTAAVQGMSDGSRSLVEAVELQNRVLHRLDETLAGQAPSPTAPTDCRESEADDSSRGHVLQDHTWPRGYH